MKNKKLKLFKKCVCGKESVVKFEDINNNNYCGKVECALIMADDCDFNITLFDVVKSICIKNGRTF